MENREPLFLPRVFFIDVGVAIMAKKKTTTEDEDLKRRRAGLEIYKIYVAHRGLNRIS